MGVSINPAGIRSEAIDMAATYSEASTSDWLEPFDLEELLWWFGDPMYGQTQIVTPSEGLVQ